MFSGACNQLLCRFIEKTVGSNAHYTIGRKVLRLKLPYNVTMRTTATVTTSRRVTTPSAV